MLFLVEVSKIQPENIIGLLDLGKDVPKSLWQMGEADLGSFEKCAAVIGSRRMTNYGRQVTEKLIAELVGEGWVIVSGGMYGVDIAAHNAAIECGGKTVVVLGMGIKNCDLDARMIQKILSRGGLILSEWDDQKGALWTFPRRNRIVAAMCQRIYVVEAGIKSGSLITVEIGEKLGRKIWAVPGPVTSKVSEGTNMLIATDRAKLWTPGNVIERRSSNNTEIYTLLQSEILSIDEIAIILSRPAAEIGAELTMMQLKGEVGERGGKYYLLTSK